MILVYILAFTGLSSIVSLLGSFLLILKNKFTESFANKTISFAAGVLMATAFLDLLPEASKNNPGKNLFLSALFGFVLFFFAERFIHRSHQHHEHKEDSGIMLIIIGDAAHNFIDGLAVAVGFLGNVNLGILTAIAIGAHEIPKEIADLTLLINKGFSKQKALAYNFLSALAAFAGALIAFYFSSYIEKNLYLFLGLTAGFFIYISASNLIPDLQEKYIKDRRFVYDFLFIFGIVLVLVLTNLLEK